MGILNVTPDSFSDGGQFQTVEAAVARAEAMIAEGARIIDVGGESSRPRGTTYGPGASAVPADEEAGRVLPVIARLRQMHPDVVVSVDSYKPSVVRAALDEGAQMVNDVTALRYHPETASFAARAGAALVLMHSLGRPGDMPQEHPYENVAESVHEALARALQVAENAGATSIVLDPGVGFGKSPQENLTLLNRIGELLELNRPVMVGISRKSTIGRALRPHDPVPLDERLFGTLGATAAAVVRGATLVRTHDVRATVEMLSLLGQTLSAT